MANVDVTNIDAERDTGVVVADIALINTVVSVANTLTIIPTRPGRKIVLIIAEVSSAGALAVTVAAGNYWYAKALGAVAVASGTKKVFCFTPARYQTSTGLKATSGNIVVTITPAEGKRLSTDHGATFMCFQMPDIDGRLPSESES